MPTGRVRLTVSQAAEALGISAEAVRQRIKRDSIPHEKVSGTVYVFVETDRIRQDTDTTDDRTGDSTGDRTEERAELVEELRDRIAYLERQVEEEREARRRADTIIMQLAARVPELTAAPDQDAPGARESAAEGEPGTNTPPDQASPQTAARPRSWWRRIFSS